MSEKELGASLRDADFIAALDEVERAYDPEIFSPLSDDDIRKLVKAMGHNTDVRAPSDRLQGVRPFPLWSTARTEATHGG